ncbi:hypothetical protein ASD77_02465 [Pseudoxanthomonas sp. Root65]|nr:hypothetical protein ASD77_02465 [Pseudoxanthomonas sp. Root65]
MPQGTRDRLRERFLDTKGHWVPEGPKGQAPMGELPRRPYVRSDERAIGYVPYEKGELPDPLPATLVAFYLPQFHTIPENDEWWGKGFTEWRNVTRALPQFEGHYQPKLPGDLGFYDLRNVEVMHEQARLAREYGISAFCFYFYWFGGKTLLETPLRNWLNDKTIDLKFCLCWANEKWTRTWDGRGDEILIDQKHSPEDDIAFIEYVAEYMRDPRYLRVDGKPVLVVYRPGLLPDACATAKRWREWCDSHDIGDLQIVYVESFESPPPAQYGLDASIAFPPNQHPATDVTTRQVLLNPAFQGELLDWRTLPKVVVPSRGNRYPGVAPGWDNEARRPGRGRVMLHASPRGYRDWLVNSIRDGNALAQHLVFINAWNEWAEGAMLEPDARLGYANLQATRDALTIVACNEDRTHAIKHASTHAVVHAWHVDVLTEILDTLKSGGLDWHLTVTTTYDRAAEVRESLESSTFPFNLIIVENRGRDMLPFLIASEHLLANGVEVVLKLHTKKSLHRWDGDAWRRDLLTKLVSGDRAREAVLTMENNHHAGLIAPTGHILGLDYYWGANERSVHSLARRTGLPPVDCHDGRFVSGSMFWVRLAAIRPLLDAHIQPSEFEPEQGQVDGTLAHAFERIIQHCVISTGFSTFFLAESGSAGDTPSTGDNTYSYASRG